MITSQLGSDAATVAASGAALIPVVGAVGAAGIKLLDYLAPTNPPCDPRSYNVLRQIAALQKASGGTPNPSQRASMEYLLELAARYEDDCRRGVTGAAYTHCTGIADAYARQMCEQSVTRRLRLRDLASETQAVTTATSTAWYKNPLVLGIGAAAILGAVLILR